MTTTEEILQHHLSAFGNNDMEEIMKDYTSNSELLTPTGLLKDLNAIRNFFIEYFEVIPTGSTFEMKKLIVTGNVAYVVWSSESNSTEIPVGTDTFFMEEGKIKYHAVADYRIIKES